MNRPFKSTGFMQFLVVAMIVFPLGCESAQSPRAEKIRDDTNARTEQIEKHVSAADEHAARADAAIVTATTRPGNPAATQKDLGSAHQELGAVRLELSPVHAAAAAIRSDAAAASTLTARVDAQLAQERSSFWSHRQKVLAGWIVASLVLLGIVAGVLAFLAHTTGLSPILQVLGDIVGAVWSAIKLAARTLFHVATLGIAFIGAKFGKAVSQKAGTSRAPPAPSA